MAKKRRDREAVACLASLQAPPWPRALMRKLKLPAESPAKCRLRSLPGLLQPSSKPSSLEENSTCCGSAKLAAAIVEIKALRAGWEAAHAREWTVRPLAWIFTILGTGGGGGAPNCSGSISTSPFWVGNHSRPSRPRQAAG